MGNPPSSCGRPGLVAMQRWDGDPLSEALCDQPWADREFQRLSSDVRCHRSRGGHPISGVWLLLCVDSALVTEDKKDITYSSPGPPMGPGMPTF